MRRLFLLLALSMPLAGFAETLQIPVGTQGAKDISLPARGEEQASVSRRFGPPEKKHPTVGHPPISRWDYREFSVYFESGRVISSVRRHQPGNLSRKE